MRIYTTAELRKNLSEVIDKAAYGRERTVVTRAGRPLAAVVSLEDLEAMEALEDLMDVRAAKKARSEGGALPLGGVVRSLDDAP